MNKPSTFRTVPIAAKVLILALGGLGFSCLLAPAAEAAIFYENSGNRFDAGESLSAAVTVTRSGGAGPLTGIVGSLGSNADLFKITIKNSVGEFMASTGNRGATEFDNTQLFLFDANGVALFANDNTPDDDPGRANPGTLRSTLRLARNTIPDGIYYLGISGFNYDPIDATGNLLFPDGQRVDGPINRTRVSAITPGTKLADWKGLPLYTGPQGNYQIDLIGAEYTSLVSPIPVEPPPVDPSPSPTVTPPPVDPSPSPTVTPPPVDPSPSPTVTPPPVDPSPSPTVTPPPVDPSPSPTVTPPPIDPSPSPSEPPVGVPEPSTAVGTATFAALSALVFLGRRRSRRG